MFNRFFPLLVLLIAIAGCKSDSSDENTQVQDDPLLISRHIIQRIPGYVSVVDDLVIRFRRNSIPNRADEIQGISIQPKVSGNWKWINDATILFQPDSPLAYDKHYLLSIDLNGISPNSYPNGEEIKMSFATRPLDLRMVIDGPKMTAGNNRSVDVSVSGTIIASDYCDPNEIENHFSSKWNKGANIGTEWRHSEDGRNHDFTITGLTQTESSSELELTWNGKSLDRNFRGKEIVTIRGYEKFSIEDVSVRAGSSPHIRVIFSHPLKEDQNLNGLVKISTEQKVPKTLVDGNILHIYPISKSNSSFELYISEKIKSHLGANLEAEYIADLKILLEKPQLKASENGVIISSAKGQSFTFQAINLDSVDVEIFEIYEDNVLQFLQDHTLTQGWDLSRVGKIIKQERVALRNLGATDRQNKWASYQLNLESLIDEKTNAIYQLRIGFRPQDVRADCEVNAFEQYVPPGEGQTIMQYRYYDHSYKYNQSPCYAGYYNPEHFLQRNVFFSNVAAIVKEGKDYNYSIAVSNINSGKSLANANVVFYNFQQQEIGHSNTSRDGYVVISTEEKASFAFITHAEGSAYVRTMDGDALSISDFDTGGKQSNDGLDGFIYMDRGVYRPGDSIFMHFMLDDSKAELPTDIPVKLTAYDARGQKVYTQVSQSHLDRIYSFTIATDVNSPTGFWRVECATGVFKTSKSVRVETIKPNRLRIELDIPELVSYHNKRDRNIPISSSWLHGAPASNLRAQVDAQWSSISPRFDLYEDYVFTDPARRVSGGQVTLYNDQLNSKGEGIMNIQLDSENTYPGMLSANLTTRVFEKGGDFSENYQRIKLSPYASYAGIDVPRNSWGGGTIQLGADAKVSSLVVDENGKTQANRKLSIGVYDIDWRWWYYSGEQYRIFELNSAEHQRSFYNATGVTDASGKVEFVIPTEDMEYGRKMIRICDTESGHCTGDYVYARGWGRSIDEEERNSLTRLEFKSDKDKYEVGQQVDLNIPSQAGTRILISIEDDQGVLFQEWVDGKANQTLYSFGASPVMAPNVYAHVTLVQPYDELNNDLPIRMYGVIPIFVEDPKTYLEPTIAAAESLIPEEKFSITVGESNERPMNYTIAIVDEGLLDLTNYKTPDPHGSFYAKQSLGVKTWDMYNYINYGIPGGPDHIISIGGDGEVGADSGSKKAIRFKPVVMSAGPFHLKGGEKATHEFTMPNYIGSVRAMVVAKEEVAYGNADIAIPVKTPLMILPTLPRVLSPGEVVTVPVSIFAMEDDISDVNTELQVSSNIEIIDSPKVTKFSQQGEQVAYYKIKVKDELGIASFRFGAKSGTYNASQEVELNIRNPNPIKTEVEDVIIQPGESWNTTVVLHGMHGTHEGIIELSTMPSLNLGDRLNYLIRYPYGCLEQTTSAAFAQLYLPDFSDYLDAGDIDKNIKLAIRRISKMQMSSGAFAYWPGGRQYPSEWGTSYAGHFLLSTRDKDYYVANSMMNSWADYQQRAARSFTIDRKRSAWSQRQSMLQQAYRLYTLGLYGSPELSAMNLLRQERGLPATAAFLLAATYAMSGKADIANALIQNANTDIKGYRERSYTYGSELRDLALIAQTLESLDRNTELPRVIKRIIDKLNSGTWYSTQSLAQALVALTQYGSQSDQKGFNAQLQLGDEINQNVTYDKSVFTLRFNPDQLENKNTSIQNTSSVPLFASVQISGRAAPLQVLDEKPVNENVSISVSYKNLNGTPINISSIPQGTDFIAEVSVKNLNAKGPILEEMALTQVIPAGWEIRSGRLNEFSDLKQDGYEYQDVRDDRVYTFFDLKGTQTYSLLLNATYEGDYVLPPVSVEAMYDKSIRAIGKAQKVKVLRASLK